MCTALKGPAHFQSSERPGCPLLLHKAHAGRNKRTEDRDNEGQEEQSKSEGRRGGRKRGGTEGGN